MFHNMNPAAVTRHFNKARSCCRRRERLLLLVLAATVAASPALAAPVSRAEALAVAEAVASFRWRGPEKNLVHGRDTSGIEVHTPDRSGGHGSPASECWQPGQENTGVAYKWGGFDTPESFAAGIRAFKAAGDVYSAEKRRRGGAAVSREAVGIDCSGFISRCWKLTRKYGTATLPSICRQLTSVADLLPADIMNQPGGHVLLFAR